MLRKAGTVILCLLVLVACILAPLAFGMPSFVGLSCFLSQSGNVGLGHMRAVCKSVHTCPYLHALSLSLSAMTCRDVPCFRLSVVELARHQCYESAQLKKWTRNLSLFWSGRGSVWHNPRCCFSLETLTSKPLQFWMQDCVYINIHAISARPVLFVEI